MYIIIDAVLRNNESSAEQHHLTPYCRMRSCRLYVVAVYGVSWYEENLLWDSQVHFWNLFEGARSHQQVQQLRSEGAWEGTSRPADWICCEAPKTLQAEQFRAKSAKCKCRLKRQFCWCPPKKIPKRGNGAMLGMLEGPPPVRECQIVEPVKVRQFEVSICR